MADAGAEVRPRWHTVLRADSGLAYCAAELEQDAP